MSKASEYSSGFFDQFRGLEKVKRAVILACSLAMEACGSYCRPPSPEARPDEVVLSPELQTSEFGKILDTYPNLHDVRNTLADMQFTNEKGETKSGYQILVDFLEHVYDQSVTVDTLNQRVEQYLSQFADRDIGKEMYLLTVAQSLWSEKQHSTPWSLRDYTAEQIQALYYEKRFHGNCIPSYPSIPGQCDIESYKGDQLDKDATYMLGKLAVKLVGADQKETTRNIVRWIKANFFHAYQDRETNGKYQEDWGWDKYRDNRPDSAQIPVVGGEIFLPVNLSRYFDERISGCHEPVAVMRSMLRSVNIPGFSIKVEGHGVLYLPLEEKFVHGDNVVIYNMVPTEVLIKPVSAYANITSEPMLTETIENAYGTNSYEISAWLHRSSDGSSLYVLDQYFKGQVTDEQIKSAQFELPQFNITRDVNGKPHNEPVPLRSLSAISEAKDPWH